MSRRFTIYEGKCERSILSYLKNNDFRFGAVIQQVISEITNINRILYMLDKETTVIIIMDTDTLNDQNFIKDRFIKNLNWLIDNTKKVIIFTQNKNLEDELIKALNLKNMRELFEHFNSEGLNEYKKTLAQISDSSLNIKMKNINLEKLWDTKIIEFILDETKITSKISSFKEEFM